MARLAENTGDRLERRARRGLGATTTARPRRPNRGRVGRRDPAALPKAGLRAGIFSTLHLPRLLVRAMTVSPFLPFTVTGTTSRANSPASIACVARCTDSRRERVLVRAGEPVLARRGLGEVAHELAVNARTAVAQHVIERLRRGPSGSRRVPAQQVGRVAHVSMPPATMTSASPAWIGLRGEHHRLEPRAAHLVDGRRRHRVGHAGEDRRLPRRCLAEPGRQNDAHV